MSKKVVAWVVVLALVNVVFTPVAFAKSYKGSYPDLSSDESDSGAWTAIGITLGVIVLGVIVVNVVKAAKNHHSSSPESGTPEKSSRAQGFHSQKQYHSRAMDTTTSGKSAVPMQAMKTRIEACHELLTPVGDADFLLAQSNVRAMGD